VKGLYLALDAATNVASVALGSPGGTVLERIVGREPVEHAGAFVPTLSHVLDEAGARIGDFQGIVVGDGPGSFTGLRITASLAKGLAHGTDCALYAVPSLTGCAYRLAETFPDADAVAALYDALRGDVFVGRWSRDGAEVLRAAVPASDLKQMGIVVVAGGPGALVHDEAVRGWTGRSPIGPPVGQASAGALLHLVWDAPDTYAIREPAGWEPEYGRPAEAQVRWEARHGRALRDSSGTR